MAARLAPVGERARDEIGHAVPDRRDRVDRRGRLHRKRQRLGVIEEQEEHDALPVEIKGEVPEGEQEQARADAHAAWTRRRSSSVRLRPSARTMPWNALRSRPRARSAIVSNTNASAARLAGSAAIRSSSSGKGAK